MTDEVDVPAIAHVPREGVSAGPLIPLATVVKVAADSGLAQVVLLEWVGQCVGEWVDGSVCG